MSTKPEKPDVRLLLGDPSLPELAADGQVVGRPTSEGGRFRILRPHARGGLGEVFVARDEELGRDVALKEIQAPYASDGQMQARFVLEAEITGGLEHPGIVPVYGLGRHVDGRPFYAMRFVRGDSLATAIRRLHGQGQPAPEAGRRMFYLRQLLSRFVAVCNAMAYAHSRGVIHRDLKPDNIMLGPYGETLVLDWGLAKLVGRAEAGREGEPAGEAAAEPEALLAPASGPSPAPTTMGAVVGTPAYMSPEQAVGMVDQLTPATDIFGLGATLYAILVGCSPYSGQALEDVQRAAMVGRFAPPRKARPWVPAALDAICRKAMAIDPARRYASARQMAEDVESWLADEPVRAWREPLRVRAGRWMRRHRTLVTGVAMTLLVALVSLAVGVALLTAANERERAAKSLAEQRGEEAWQNYKAALRVLNTFCIKVAEDPHLEEEGLEWLPEDLFTEARQVLDQFVQQKPDEPRLVAEAAYTLVRLESAISKTGSKPRVFTLLENARDVFDALLRDNPDSADFQFKRIKIYTNLGVTYEEAGRWEEARKTDEMAARFCEEYLRLHPEEKAICVDLAKVHGNLARLSIDEGRLDEAERELRIALGIYEDLSRVAPGEEEYQYLVASTLNNLGVLRNRRGRCEAAPADFQAARKKLERLAEAHKTRPDYQRELGTSQNGAATSRRFLPGRSAEAVADYQAAIKTYERLVDFHPTAIRYQDDLAVANGQLAGMLFNQGKVAEAMIHWQAARKLWEPIAVKLSETPLYQDKLARCVSCMAGALDNILGKPEEADPLYREAVRRFEALAQQGPNAANYAASLAIAYNNLGDFLFRNDQAAEAADVVRQALESYRRLDRQQSTPATRATVARAMALLSRVYSKLGRGDEALRVATQAAATLQADAKQPGLQPVLLRIQVARAEALSRLGRHAEALDEWDHVVQALPAPANLIHVLGRAEALARAGKHERAAADAKLLLGSASDDGPMLYRLAALHAVAAATLDSKLPPAERERLTTEYSALAVGLLDKARALGYFKTRTAIRKLQEDPALALLRGRDDFKKLLSPTAAKP